MSEKSDLVHVVNRTALIVENILNQVIEAFCEPRKEFFMFFWNVILDRSIMPMGAKVRVATAIAQELEVKIEQDAFHKVMILRNAFAHHKTGSHPVITASKTEEEGEVHYQLQTLSQSGKLSRKRREDALAEFDTAFTQSKASLVAMLVAIKAKHITKQ